MVNKKGILNDIEFENQLNKLGDNHIDLIKFVARQVYEVRITAFDHAQRLTTLENRDKKLFGTIGGISGAIGAGIVAAIDYIMRR